MATQTPSTDPMHLGMIGLGRMGANMVKRLTAAGHVCVGHDVSIEALGAVVAEGIDGARTLQELVAKLPAPRQIWIMVPAAFVGSTVDALAPLLDPGDIVIDGGNTWYVHDIERSEQLAGRGLHLVDVGTSGGVFGLERGYCLMVGGDAEPVQHLVPIFDALAPGIEAAPRTFGLEGEPLPRERGWLHCGPSGAGHFVKMVHNGIEYGLMASYAEGMNILAKAGIGLETGEHRKDAEHTPLFNPHHYRYELDLASIAEVWRRGSVISSWLLDLTATALHLDPELSGFAGRVADSGEGRWTLHAAIDEAVPAPVLSAAVYSRFSSRGRSDVADKLLSAMRAQFGGHVEVKEHTP